MQEVRIRFVVALGLAIGLLFMAGCAAAPEPQGPSPEHLAIVASCDDAPNLEIPTGANSAQLEELLYGAYLEVRGLLAACRQAQETAP